MSWQWYVWFWKVHGTESVSLASSIGTVAAGLIAWFALSAARGSMRAQERLAAQQVKISLFERRFQAVYELDQIVETALDGAESVSELFDFDKSQTQASFLFSSTVSEKIKEISQAAVQLVLARSLMLSKGGVDAGVDYAGKEKRLKSLRRELWSTAKEDLGVIESASIQP